MYFYKIVCIINCESIMRGLFFLIWMALIMLSTSLNTLGEEFGRAPGTVEPKEAFPIGKYEIPGYKSKSNSGEQLQSVNPYATTVFTFSDIVVFSYFDNTEIEIYNADGQLVTEYILGLDKYKVNTLSQGIYKIVGNKSYSVLVGDPVSTYVLGFSAVNENGYGLSTKLNTYMPSAYSTDKFLIFAYEDNTEYTLKNLTTDVVISAGILNEGEWYEYSGRNVFMSVTANKPVAALSYNDQGYMVPSNNGSFSGTKFYSYSGDVGGWTNGIIVTGYNDNTNVVVRNLQTDEIIWEGVLDEGEVHAIQNTSQRFFSVISDKNVTVGNHPYAGYTGNYYYLTRHIDKGGFGIGTLFYVPTVQNRFDVFSYESDNNVKITRTDNEQVIFDDVLNEGEGYSFNSVHAVYKVESSKNVSVVTSFGGSAGADFMPLNYSTSLTDLSVSSSDITFNPDPVVQGQAVVLNCNVNNNSQLDAENVLVRFYLGNPDMGGIQIGNDQSIANLAANTSAQVSVNWTVPQDAEGQYIFVRIDPNSMIIESNESNNTASKALLENQDLLPPLSIQINAPFTLDISGGELAPNPFTVEAVIFNNGTVAATSVTAELLELPVGLELDQSSEPALQNIGDIPGRQSATVIWKVKANEQSSGFLKYSMNFDATNADAKDVSRQINVPDITAPAAPTGLEVVSSSNGTVVLQWNANTEEDLFGYELYYDSDGSGAPYTGNDANEGPSPINVGNVTTFTLTGLDLSNVYWFALKAFDTRPNYSGFSNEAQSVVESLCPVVILSTPENNEQLPFAEPVSIDYSWLPAEGAVSYQIEISNDQAFTDIMFTTSVSETTYTHSSENYMVGDYWWRVRMFDGNDFCNFSPARKLTIINTGALKLNIQDQSVCREVMFVLGSENLIEGGSGDYSIFWHPANLVSDPNIQNPFAQVNFTTIFSITVFDNVTGEMVNGSLTVFVNPPATVDGPVLYQHSPKNTALNLNSIITVSGGVPPYTIEWYRKDGTLINDPVNHIPPVGANQYTVTASDETSCVSKVKRVTVWVSPRKDADIIIAGMNNSSYMLSYPNPVESNVELFAAFSEPQNNVTVKVMDLLGNELIASQHTCDFDLELSLDMSGFASGVYMLLIDSGNDIIVKKIIKQ